MGRPWIMSVSPTTYAAKRRPDRFTYSARTNPAIIAAKHKNASGGRIVMTPNPPGQLRSPVSMTKPKRVQVPRSGPDG